MEVQKQLIIAVLLHGIIIMVCSLRGCGVDPGVPVTFYAYGYACGNVDSTIAILTVNDTTAPQIITPARDTLVYCDGTGNTIDFDNWTSMHAGAEAVDDCDGVMWRHDVLSTIPDCGNTRRDSVQFTVYDACGN